VSGQDEHPAVVVQAGLAAAVTAGVIGPEDPEAEHETANTGPEENED
jgi:hypothetical protein